jgi:hypothetical protein
MRLITSIRFSMAAGAALFVAACGHHAAETTNTSVANDLDSNMMMAPAGNDASAMESATNVAEPLPTANVGDTSNSSDHGGGDAGRDPVESNVAGM